MSLSTQEMSHKRQQLSAAASVDLNMSNNHSHEKIFEDTCLETCPLLGFRGSRRLHRIIVSFQEIAALLGVDKKHRLSMGRSKDLLFSAELSSLPTSEAPLSVDSFLLV